MLLPRCGYDTGIPLLSLSREEGMALLELVRRLLPEEGFGPLRLEELNYSGNPMRRPRR